MVSTLQNEILGDVCAGELEQRVGDARSWVISLVAHSHRLQPNPSKCPVVSGLGLEVRSIGPKVLPLLKATPGTLAGSCTCINVG